MGSHRRPDMRLTATAWRVSGRYPDCRTAVEAALPPCPPAPIYRPRHARQETTVPTTTATDKWGPGPWSGEPDHAQWTDPDTGLCCVALRDPLGHWRGYVAVPQAHPWHGRNLDDLTSVVQVHGGLNFARLSADAAGWVPSTDAQWWLGFDCGHVGDEVPASTARDDLMAALSSDVYRDLRFVRSECATLAAQIKENEK